MKLRVTLVDDNVMDRLLATEAFEEACPACTLETYDSGRAALGHLRRTEALPDVILLDLNMPGMNGFDVLSAMKADARLQMIPVVILTTSGNLDDIAQAYTLHASSYVVKAPSFAAFVAQVDAFIGYWRLNRPALN